MSAVSTSESQINAPRTVVVVSWKTPIIFGVFTVLFALLPALAPREGATTFRLTAGVAFFAVPDIVIPATATAWVCAVLLAAATASLSGW